MLCHLTRDNVCAFACRRVATALTMIWKRQPNKPVMGPAGVTEIAGHASKSAGRSAGGNY